MTDREARTPAAAVSGWTPGDVVRLKDRSVWSVDRGGDAPDRLLWRRLVATGNETERRIADTAWIERQEPVLLVHNAEIVAVAQPIHVLPVRPPCACERGAANRTS